MQGLPLVRNGITLISEHDPVRRCNRIADAVTVRGRTLFFCPSPLFGYGLERLLDRIKSEAPDSAVLCIEAEPELYELTLKKIDSSISSNKNLRITNITDAAFLCSFVRENWGARAFRRIETVKFTGGWQLFPELYNSLSDALRREIATDWSNALTLAKLGRLYIKNAVQNLSLMRDFLPLNELSFGEAPVLVIGAGPSLDETLDALEKHFPETCRLPQKRTFRIICADTCAAALKERNIIPDLVVILESQHWNLRDFVGCRDWNVSAAVDLSALPQSAKMLGSAGYLFFTPWTRLSIFERLKSTRLLPPVIPPLGSVGLSAVEIARRVSRGKILCAGLDFSFSIDKYHARSTPGHYAKLNTQNRLLGLLNSAALNEETSFAAVSKSGTHVLSSPIMRNYRDLFENEFSGDKRLFDITGSGLPLGIKTLAIEEALSFLSNKIVRKYSVSEQLPPKNVFSQPESRENAGLVRQPIGLSDKSNGSPVDETVCVYDGGNKTEINEKIIYFMEEEKKRLTELKNILTGEKKAEGEYLNVLINECDYLWAHFPDYSGGRIPDAAEIAKGGDKALSFLKRVRVEIDSMLTLFARVMGEDFKRVFT